jgi:hypothetical protein
VVLVNLDDLLGPSVQDLRPQHLIMNCLLAEICMQSLIFSFSILKLTFLPYSCLTRKAQVLGPGVASIACNYIYKWKQIG